MPLPLSPVDLAHGAWERRFQPYNELCPCFVVPLGHLARLLAASQGMLNGLFFTLLTFTLFKRVLGGS